MYLLLGIALAGFLAQLIDGSLGMGYGVSSTTLLLTVGLTPALASASVHLAEIGTTAVSGASHWRLGNVDMKIMALLAIPGGIGAFLGAVVLANLSTEAARPLVSVVLLVLGAVIVFRFLHARRTRQAPAVLHDQPINATPRRSRRWILTPLGVAGGFLDASGGGGWGPVVTSTLMASGRLDDISFTAGWAEGAITTGLNAVWGVVNHLGGSSSPANPGPGDLLDELGPISLD